MHDRESIEVQRLLDIHAPEFAEHCQRCHISCAPGYDDDGDVEQGRRDNQEDLFEETGCHGAFAEGMIDTARNQPQAGKDAVGDDDHESQIPQRQQQDFAFGNIQARKGSRCCRHLPGKDHRGGNGSFGKLPRGFCDPLANGYSLRGRWLRRVRGSNTFPCDLLQLVEKRLSCLVVPQNVDQILKFGRRGRLPLSNRSGLRCWLLRGRRRDAHDQCDDQTAGCPYQCPQE
ncbi:hypothetical protein [Pararhizobium antarcticum]|uniref:hypothetical protein n=1 Tax=Pararhizobium antarcticum TaxID=1798805 RepID=UPI001AECC12F|nr:hypothetical protein [Pararhizobium antarcticum]